MEISLFGLHSESSAKVCTTTGLAIDIGMENTWINGFIEDTLMTDECKHFNQFILIRFHNGDGTRFQCRH